MIDYATFHLIKQLKTVEKLSINQISAELRLDPRTVQRVILHTNYQPRKGIMRASILDPYKDIIKAKVNNYDFTVTQVFQHLQKNGYKGSYGLVRNYVRLISPKGAPAFLTLLFAPGECAQVDWGEYGTVQVGEYYAQVELLCDGSLL